MNFYALLLQLAGAVTLLLWAVRMVRTGVERAYGTVLRRALRETHGGRLHAAGAGLVLAVLLQSSTAVAVLCVGFVGSGILRAATALAAVLGADVGSALVVRILSFDLQWLIPFFLIAGGWMFLRGKARTMRQNGRILIGIALILTSLDMIGAATEPLRESAFLSASMGYLGRDLVTAFLIGAGFTWLIHSSVAAVLLVMTLAVTGMVPPLAGVALVLGANLGGGLIAVGLTRNATAAGRRVAIGNLVCRGTLALGGLAMLLFAGIRLPLTGQDAAWLIVDFHLAFNGAVLLAGLPLTGILERVLGRWVTESPSGDAGHPATRSYSALDQSVLGVPGQALASATRELLRMSEIVEIMLRPVMELFETGDKDRVRQIKALERDVDQIHSAVKLYLARIEYEEDDTDEMRRGTELSSFAISLKHAGDIIARSLMHLVEVRRDQRLSFSKEGWRELNDLHDRVTANMQLALNVLVSEDRDSARQLLAEKDRLRKAERASYAGHLKRLQSGTVKSIETSDLHLETVRAYRLINSLFASVAYPILAESGDLLETRLADSA